MKHYVYVFLMLILVACAVQKTEEPPIDNSFKLNDNLANEVMNSPKAPVFEARQTVLPEDFSRFKNGCVSDKNPISENRIDNRLNVNTYAFYRFKIFSNGLGSTVTAVNQVKEKAMDGNIVNSLTIESRVLKTEGTDPALNNSIFTTVCDRANCQSTPSNDILSALSALNTCELRETEKSEREVMVGQLQFRHANNKSVTGFRERVISKGVIFCQNVRTGDGVQITDIIRSNDVPDLLRYRDHCGGSLVKINNSLRLLDGSTVQDSSLDLLAIDDPK